MKAHTWKSAQAVIEDSYAKDVTDESRYSISNR